jgi:hypothetical protein
MSKPNLTERLAANGLRLSEPELAPFGEIVAEVDRISALLRAAGLTYADEPAICFAAPKP